MRKLTQAAYTASIIRAELKDRIPGTKFFVTSENYSGGNTVNVRYDRSATSPTTKEVEAIVGKYQAGHFDGMTDSYEYTNKTAGPTVWYVFVQCDYPKEVRESVNAVMPRSASPEQWQRMLLGEFTAFYCVDCSLGKQDNYERCPVHYDPQWDDLRAIAQGNQRVV